MVLSLSRQISLLDRTLAKLSVMPARAARRSPLEGKSAGRTEGTKVMVELKQLRTLPKVLQRRLRKKQRCKVPSKRSLQIAAKAKSLK